MKIGLRSNNGAKERLLFAQQVGADGASIWASACPGYAERCYLTAGNVREVRERFARYDLELTGIGLGGDCIKNQLLGLPGRDQEIDNVCRTIRAIGARRHQACGLPTPTARASAATQVPATVILRASVPLSIRARAPGSIRAQAPAAQRAAARPGAEVLHR